jgi:hypothetical protein
MQVEQLAEHATLLAAAYPEGLVNGMTAYFNLCTSHYLNCLIPLSKSRLWLLPVLHEAFAAGHVMACHATVSCVPGTLCPICTLTYVQLYADVPIFKGLNLPPFMLHWFHALNMGIVLGAMGGYGTFLGWNMRMNPSQKMELAPGPGANLGKIFPCKRSGHASRSPPGKSGILLTQYISAGKSSSELHSTLMGAMGVIFFLGANGGIVLSLVQDKPITESVHFTTAMIGFAMLAIQVCSPSISCSCVSFSLSVSAHAHRQISESKQAKGNAPNTVTLNIFIKIERSLYIYI